MEFSWGGGIRPPALTFTIVFGHRDWKCPKCGQVSPNVPTYVPDQWCPMCGAQMEKVWTAPETIFKGRGWTEKFY